jgi:glycosyltransferase 2 family protein
MEYASVHRQLGPTGRTAGRGHLPYDAFGLFRRSSSKRFSTSTLRNVLYVISLAVALYLLVPQLPGLEHSANVLDGSSEPFLMAALAAEIMSLVCYSEVLGNAVVAASRIRPSLERRRRSGLGPWFMFRLAVTGHEAGRLLPGGAVLQVGIILDELRRRGLKPEHVSVALAVTYLLVYGALSVLCAASFIYLTLHGYVAPAATVVTITLVVFLAGVVFVDRAANARSFHAELNLGE